MEELKARILEIVEDYEEGISVLDNDMAQAGIDPKSDFVNTIEQLLEERECRAREEGRKHMQGWECPKCGSVYSPLTFECTSCKNSRIKVRTSDKTSGYDNTSYLN